MIFREIRWLATMTFLNPASQVKQVHYDMIFRQRRAMNHGLLLMTGTPENYPFS